MASNKTFLEALNAVLNRVGVLQGATGDLTALTATAGSANLARARSIAVGIQVWNETIHQVYDLGGFAGEMASATFVGISGTREYALATDLERMAGERPELRIVKGATNNLWLEEYRGGYQQMYVDQLTATQYTGTPTSWAINPVSGKLRFDTENNDSDTATSTWNYLYEKRLGFTTTSTATTAVFPFSDTTVDALIPVVAESYNAVMKEKFDARALRTSISRALRFMSQSQPNDRYGTRYGRN